MTIARTFASPTTAETRMIKRFGHSEKTAHEALPPEAANESTVRPRTETDGTVVYFAKIGDHVYDWSPIQGAWFRAL